MTKMPKKHKFHELPRKSRRQLEEMFGNWIINEPRDIGSGIEYGQDYLIEIVTKNGDLTGQEFRVQSKVITTKSGITRNGIGYSLKVSTLNYLDSLAVPVLFHFIDNKSGTGYVMWFSDWIAQNSNQNWHKSKKKRINIPLTNIFDQNMVAKIQSHIEQFFLVHRLRKRVDFINSHSKSHRADLILDNDSGIALTAIHSLNSEAIPQLTPLDKDAYLSYREAIEYGGVTTIQGKFRVSNLPLFPNSLSEIDITDGKIIQDLSNTPNQPLRVRLININNDIIYTINYLELKPDQIGTKFTKWSASIMDNLLTFVQTLDNEAKKITLKFDSNIDQHKKYNPQLIYEFIKFFDSFIESEFIEIELLRTNHTEKLKIQSRTSVRQDNQYKKTLEDIIYIIQSCEIEVKVPIKFSIEEIQHIDNLVNIIKKGTDILDHPKIRENTQVIIENDLMKAKENLRLLKLDETHQIVIKRSQKTIATIFDTSFDIGNSEFVFEDVKLVNEADVIQKIQAKLDNIQMKFTFDKNKSYIRFPRWLPSHPK